MISPLFRMSGDEARGLLFGLTESNKLQLRKYPGMPSMRELIRDGRVKYDPNDPQEHWKTYKELVDEVDQKGVAYGDCEDLAVAVAAEDQVRHGVQSLPFAYSPRQGLFHVVTAVPNGGMGRGEAVSGSGGKIPFGFDSWPTAMGSHSVPGYVLQDPSRAAGMGSFGYAPLMEAGMTRYGAEGRGLGGAVRALREGILGSGTTRSHLSQLGQGIRKGAGLGDGWATRLGEKIPGAIGVGHPIEPKEESAVRALRKGMTDDEEEAPSPEEDDVMDIDEDLGDEEFGGLDDAVVAEMFGADDEDDLAEDDAGDGGGFHLSSLPSWVLPAAIGTAAGAALVGTGVALLGKKKRKRNKYAPEETSAESMAGLDDTVAAEMFGGDDLFSDLDDDLIDAEEEFGDDLDDESFAGISSLRRTDLFSGDFRLVHDEDDEDDLYLDEG